MLFKAGPSCSSFAMSIFAMRRGLALFPSLLPLTSVLLILIRPTSGEAVTWQSPSAGDVYGSGSTIVGQWIAAQKVVSPSFSLCMLGSNSARDEEGGTCGSKVWPTIDQSGESYMIYLSLPNVTSPSQFYLRMKDDFGSTMNSPLFSLNPALSDGNDDSVAVTSSASAAVSSTSAPISSTSSAISSSTLRTSTSQSPTSSASTSKSSTWKSPTSSASASKSSTSKLPTSSSHSSKVLTSMSSTTSSSTSASASASISAILTSDIIPSLPNFDAARMPSPTVAYALPLSVVVSVLLAAGALSIHHRRKLKNERLQEKQGISTLALSRQSSATGSTSTHTLIDAAPRPYPPTIMGWLRSSSGSTKAEHMPTYTGGQSPPLKRLPRRMTREPFYTDTGRRRKPSLMPAGAFRAAVSPMPPPKSKFDLDDELENEDRDLNASVNDSVVSRYFHPSPIPPPPAPYVEPSETVVIPQRAHVRRCAEAEVNKPLPASPEDAGLYDAVARRLSGVGGTGNSSRR